MHVVVLRGRRPVGQVEVDLLEAELVEALGDRGTRLVAVVAVVPELGGDVELVARDAAASHCAADSLLVAVARRRVDHAIADLEGVLDRPLALAVIADLEHAETELGHLDTVVEGDGVHRASLSFRCSSTNPTLWAGPCAGKSPLVAGL